MDIERILDRLDKVRNTGTDKWCACCPAHDDKTPSLSISLNDSGDKILLKCWAGCSFSEIVAAMNLEIHDLFAGGHAPRQMAPGVSRRKLADALEIELLILAQLAHKRAHGDEISEHDSERERIAWLRVDAARRVAQ